ncbi:hypothetical protein BC943DRAFT_67406 [Umbelopsis sp. AD052]|nr:hypothetical protein BC943DRAFT_67406 [Umbelopsis sp. AD052]
MNRFEANRINRGLVKGRRGRFNGFQRLTVSMPASTWVLTNKTFLSPDRSDKKSWHVNELLRSQSLNGGLVKGRRGRFNGFQRLTVSMLASTWVLTNKTFLSPDGSDKKSRHVNGLLRSQSLNGGLVKGRRGQILWIPKAHGVNAGFNMGPHEQNVFIT